VPDWGLCRSRGFPTGPHGARPSALAASQVVRSHPGFKAVENMLARLGVTSL
jgi:hypothetical protein